MGRARDGKKNTNKIGQEAKGLPAAITIAHVLFLKKPVAWEELI